MQFANIPLLGCGLQLAFLYLHFASLFTFLFTFRITFALVVLNFKFKNHILVKLPEHGGSFRFGRSNDPRNRVSFRITATYRPSSHPQRTSLSTYEYEEFRMNLSLLSDN
jgi:hypothetical protein